MKKKTKAKVEKFEMNEEYIMGRNPVREALKSGRKIKRLIVKEGRSDRTLHAIIQEAESRHIPIERKEKAYLDDRVSSSSHQGVIAIIEPYRYLELEDLLASIDEHEEDVRLILADGIEDPQNLGAIMRVAECAGAQGLVIPKNRSARVTASVVKASAGASEYLSCARVTNLTAAIEYLKSKGFWIGACDMDGQSIYETDLTGKLAIVIGNEAKGISRLVKENCDFVISIPLLGQIQSLNASSAASVVLYESTRQILKKHEK